MKSTLIFLLLVVFWGSVACESDSPEDQNNNSELVKVINDYRASQGLNRIPESPSLNHVAELHVHDLAENNPDAGNCNLHSWSDQGEWSACCYTPDHANASCMWDKPRELTDYTGNGYEIAAWSSSQISATQALEIWKGSSSHHDVILNRGIWDDAWLAIGAAVYEGYAVVWFGKESDE